MDKSPCPLPANRAFVVQLRACKETSEIRHDGRIEHLSSGRAARFSSEDELWAFVDKVLLGVEGSASADKDGP